MFASNCAKTSFTPSECQSPLIKGVDLHREWAHYFRLLIMLMIRDCARYKILYRTNQQYADEIGCSANHVGEMMALAVRRGILHKKSWIDKLHRHKTGKIKKLRHIRIKWRALRRRLGMAQPPPRFRVQKEVNGSGYTHPSRWDTGRKPPVSTTKADSDPPMDGVDPPDPPAPSKKTCFICEQNLHIEWFGKSLVSPDGRKSACIACEKEITERRKEP